MTHTFLSSIWYTELDTIKVYSSTSIGYACFRLTGPGPAAINLHFDPSTDGKTSAYINETCGPIESTEALTEVVVKKNGFRFRFTDIADIITLWDLGDWTFSDTKYRFHESCYWA